MASNDVVQLRTALSLAQIKSLFSATLQPLSRKVEFGSVAPSSNPFDEADDFSAYASLKTFAGGWIVQIYVTDQGDSRLVRIVPVGSSALGRAVGGLKNTYSLATSREKADLVVDAFRRADAQLSVH